MTDKEKELEKYNSKYTQLSQDALDRWQNRDDFKYDLNSDAIYNQYKNNFMNQGKIAAKDVMGQASSLTGGYANSYMQTVGNQAYQGYLQKLNDIVPELQQNAYNKYLQEGDDLYKQWQLMSSLENQDYSRYIDKQNFEYQKEQDALAQQNWQKQFDADEAYRKWQMSKSSGSSKSKDTTKQTVQFDNGNVGTENIKKMQEYLGISPTGYWDDYSYNLSGGLTADEAWQMYNEGYMDEDGNAVSALSADKNYAAQSYTPPTNANYVYTKDMFNTTPPRKTLTETQQKNLETAYKKAVENDDFDRLFEMYTALYNQGYDVSEWESVFDEETSGAHMKK